MEARVKELRTKVPDIEKFYSLKEAAFSVLVLMVILPSGSFGQEWYLRIGRKVISLFIPF